MSRLRSTLPALILGLLAFAAPTMARAELRVVTTTADVASVVKAIGGEHVAVDTLALHTQDPHWVDARPNLALKLARADLLVAIGLDLEIGWLPTLQTGSRNPRIQKGASGYVECASMVSLMDVPTRRVSRADGDVHPGGNPHFMYDPRRVKKVAKGLTAKLKSLDAARAAQYDRGLADFLKQLEAAEKRWQAKLEGLRGKNVVTYHSSLTYLADWLGVRVVDVIESRPGTPPTPRHIAKVLTTMKAQQVVAVIQESWFPRNTGQLLAERTSATLIPLPGAPNTGGGESYFDFMNAVINALGRAASS